MPRAYFEPESLDALAEVFAEAKRRLNNINDPTTLDLLASRILGLAADGLSPWMILREIVEQDSPHGGANGATLETTSSNIQQNRSSS